VGGEHVPVICLAFELGNVPGEGGVSHGFDGDRWSVTQEWSSGISYS
jgi:hypothetical protein